jgi:two-component sensor histidine kinase
MALVHERLYRADSLEEPDYAAYLKDLVVAIGRAFRQRNAEVSIEIRTAVQGLGVDAAVPIGLIVNELVSNSLKHAFPGASKGRIVVQLCGSKEAGYELSVHDDGIGLSTDMPLETAPSMGLRLVSILTRQLHGQLTSQSEGGTRWIIRFGGATPDDPPPSESGKDPNEVSPPEDTPPR